MEDVKEQIKILEDMATHVPTWDSPEHRVLMACIAMLRAQAVMDHQESLTDVTVRVAILERIAALYKFASTFNHGILERDVVLACIDILEGEK